MFVERISGLFKISQYPQKDSCKDEEFILWGKKWFILTILKKNIKWKFPEVDNVEH